MIELKASEGMTLSNGEVYSKHVYLGVNDSQENWHEIPDSEVPTEEDFPSMEEELADAKNALKILGVE